MKRYLLVVPLLGFSGFLSAVSVYFSLEIEFFQAFGFFIPWPGIFFGVATGLLFVAFFGLKTKTFLIWILLSSVSWYFANMTYVFMAISSFSYGATSSNLNVEHFVIPGIIGAFLLGIFFQSVVKDFGTGKIAAPALTGGLLGVFIQTIVKKLITARITVLALTGGLLGLVMYVSGNVLSNYIVSGDNFEQLVATFGLQFAIWQIGIASFLITEHGDK